MLAKARASYGDGYGTNGDYEHVLPFFENYAGGELIPCVVQNNTASVRRRSTWVQLTSGNDVIRALTARSGAMPWRWPLRWK